MISNLYIHVHVYSVCVAENNLKINHHMCAETTRTFRVPWKNGIDLNYRCACNICSLFL